MANFATNRKQKTLGCPEYTYYSTPEPKIKRFKKELTLAESKKTARVVYLYGFNGMEKDDEVKGSGNHVDFGARGYDPRLGRWLSVDPLFSQHSGWSPYGVNRDNPILYIDQDGLEWVNYYDKLVAQKEKALLDKPNNKKLSRELNRLKNQQLQVNEVINEIKTNDIALYNYVENLTYRNPKSKSDENVLVTVRLGSPNDPERFATAGTAGAETRYRNSRSEGGPIYIGYSSLDGNPGQPGPINRDDEIGFDITIWVQTNRDFALANEIGDVMFRMEYPAASIQEGGNVGQTYKEYTTEGGSGKYSFDVQDKYTERKKSGEGKDSSSNPYPIEK